MTNLNRHGKELPHYLAHTFIHQNQASCQQSHTVGRLMVVQVLETPSTPIGSFVHVSRGVGNYLKESLLLRLAKIVIQKVISSGKSNQRVSKRDFIPWCILY